MFPLGLLLHSSNNFGHFKTEAVIGLDAANQKPTFEPLGVMYGREHFERSLKGSNFLPENRSNDNIKNREIELRKNHEKQSKTKLKKCFHKLFKKKGKKNIFWKKKSLLPLLAGFFAAKGLLLPLAIKSLAFVSLKGLLIGLFSATILSLRGIMNHSYGHYSY